MVKRIACLLVSLIFIGMSGAVPAAADTLNTVSVEQVSAIMPQLTLYYYTNGQSGAVNKSDITAYLGEEKLRVGDTYKFSDKADGTGYIFLVDVSASINNGDFAAVKKSLVTWVNNLKPHDRMVVITFGEEVKTVISGSESADSMINTINGLKNNGGSTKFYDGIASAYNMVLQQNQNFPVHKAAIVVTDGVDDDKGGNTAQEVSAMLSENVMPMYAMCVDSADNNSADQFGVLARSSGGSIGMFNSSNADSQFKSLFDHINSPYVIKLNANSNKPGGTKHLNLSLKLNGQQVSKQMNVNLLFSAPDNVSPKVKKVVNVSNNQLRVYYSEDVLGGGLPGNFKITDADGKTLKVAKAVYSNSGDYYSTLTFDDTVYSGDYLLKVTGVTDNTVEGNSLSGDFKFSVKGASAIFEQISDFFAGYWWFVVFLILAVAGIIAYIIFNKRGKREKRVPQGQQSEHVFSPLDRHHIKSNADRKISLTVTDSKGKSKNIDVDFDRSIFIGRSDQCEVFFDDPQISRQHCVIEQSDDSFFVTDLNTTNGTYLNGVKIHSKEKLASGDVLTVGQFKLTLSLKDLLNENVVNP